MLLLSVFIFPWWITAPLAILGTFFFISFYEVLLIGFIADRLFILSIDNGFIKTFPFTFSAILIFLLSFWIREHIRLGQK